MAQSPWEADTSYDTQSFIAAFTETRNWTLSWASLNQSTI
jgi:hypothetical protein